jgi:hypothetical protein
VEWVQVNARFLSGPSEGLKIRGCQYYLVIIICPLGWDRVNWSAKIWWFHGTRGTPGDDRPDINKVLGISRISMSPKDWGRLPVGFLLCSNWLCNRKSSGNRERTIITSTSNNIIREGCETISNRCSDRKYKKRQNSTNKQIMDLSRRFFWNTNSPVLNSYSNR